MPTVHRSFYTDRANGYKYWTFIKEELPSLARTFFPLSTRREDNFVAGLSMGGYGAFKLALSCPDKFAAAASLSGALNITSVSQAEEEQKVEFSNVFGDLSKLAESKNDLFYLLNELVKQEKAIPKLYQYCGKEDFLYQDNIKFRDYARKLNLDLTYEEEPGEHEWGLG